MYLLWTETKLGIKEGSTIVVDFIKLGSGDLGVCLSFFVCWADWECSCGCPLLDSSSAACFMWCLGAGFVFLACCGVYLGVWFVIFVLSLGRSTLAALLLNIFKFLTY